MLPNQLCPETRRIRRVKRSVPIYLSRLRLTFSSQVPARLVPVSFPPALIPLIPRLIHRPSEALTGTTAPSSRPAAEPKRRQAVVCARQSSVSPTRPSCRNYRHVLNRLAATGKKTGKRRGIMSSLIITIISTSTNNSSTNI